MPKAALARESRASVEKQISAFIAKFTPENAKLIRKVRATLHRRFPTAFELVYDNYNFFVIGYASSERASDAILSLAAFAKGINIFFMDGKSLLDPHKLLAGAGKSIRHVRVPDAAFLGDKRLEALFKQAEASAEPPLPKTGKGLAIVKSISAKQRSRR